jgi:hypothetical protein
MPSDWRQSDEGLMRHGAESADAKIDSGLDRAGLSESELVTELSDDWFIACSAGFGDGVGDCARR